jgi:hypothetical protein
LGIFYKDKAPVELMKTFSSKENPFKIEGSLPVAMIIFSLSIISSPDYP